MLRFLSVEHRLSSLWKCMKINVWLYVLCYICLTVLIKMCSTVIVSCSTVITSSRVVRLLTLNEKIFLGVSAVCRTENWISETPKLSPQKMWCYLCWKRKQHLLLLFGNVNKQPAMSVIGGSLNEWSNVTNKHVTKQYPTLLACI